MSDTAGSPSLPDAAAPRAGTRPVPNTNLTAAWPAKAADTVELVVNTIHDRAVRPVLVGARAVVFGLLILTLLVVVITTVSVGVVRLFDIYLFPGRVWASYALLGTVFCVAGFFVWAKRNADSADQDRRS
jgi:hypothetical protein